MEKRDNYLIQRDRTRAYFLKQELSRAVRLWKLEEDECFLYLTYLNTHYRVEKATGILQSIREDQVKDAGFEETLSVFDLLFTAEERPTASGVFAPVNSLKGKPVSIGVGQTDFTREPAALYDADHDRFRRACEAVGGRAISIGDIGYEFSVFADLKLRLKFYGSDEEFPAQITFLWNDNALSYLKYETAFYVMNDLMRRIREGIVGPGEE